MAQTPIELLQDQDFQRVLCVVAHPDARAAIAFDAAAMVTVEWRPMTASGLARPGQFLPRRRARVVELVLDDVGVTVIRFENDPDYIVLASAS